MGTQQVSRSTVVAATPQQVFDLVADFRRHPDFDGSGSVKQGLRGPDRLHLGAKFGMRMRIGLPYVMVNEVVEFAEPSRIGWQHVNHHVWRYELDPVEHGTRVTETFDWSHARMRRPLERFGLVARNVRSLEATLRRLEAIFGTP
ncbi:MAG TPA: SRPBCC family protein [Mycobacteriales bacterium]|jgi:hypothetical protein|nr:SRPBCC family protein [Mycobacteriales bacterium]